jgi:uncharacterized protein (TIGR00299 family) protein
VTDTRLGWVDATGGVAGDMLLAACLDAGADLEVVQASLDRLDLGISVTTKSALRGGLAATQVTVSAPDSASHRRLPDVLDLLRRLDEEAAARAGEVFHTLARAEAHVHRTSVEDVHFHEVGALDAIADVVGVVVALASLRIDRLVSSPIALGGGHATGAHGPIPLPGPAVLELLRARNAAAFGGPVDVELATPTGVALLTTLADEFASMPLMQPERIGAGAGSRDLPGHANLTRLVIGVATASSRPDAEPAVLLETNVDDLDPRAWPAVLSALLAAGASDAWLTPILMKKGRPAHTLCVLAEPGRVDDLERIVFEHTSTIGLRRIVANKVALPRETIVVDVLGAPIRVKVARHDGRVVNVTAEYDDVAALAAERGLPVADLLRQAQRAAER